MRVTSLASVVAAALTVVVVSGCGYVGGEPEKSAILTLTAFSSVIPYDVSWEILGGKGLNGTGSEPVATHEYSRKLVYGQKPLTIKFRMTTQRKVPGMIGSVSVLNEEGDELKEEPLDPSLGVAQLVYVTVPPK